MDYYPSGSGMPRCAGAVPRAHGGLVPGGIGHGSAARKKKTVCRVASQGRHGRPLPTARCKGHITPIQRKMSLRLATTMSNIKMEMPTYSALIMNVSEGLRRVTIS